LVDVLVYPLFAVACCDDVQSAVIVEISHCQGGIINVLVLDDGLLGPVPLTVSHPHLDLLHLVPAAPPDLVGADDVRMGVVIEIGDDDGLHHVRILGELTHGILPCSVSVEDLDPVGLVTRNDIRKGVIVEVPDVDT